MMSGYAEHHFGVGSEGGGIETDFILTTQGELWIFSYYPNNPITITDLNTKQVVYDGVAGQAQVLANHPGAGLFRVRSKKGISVMGGASTCGAEFSPASNMYEVDEALFDVVQQIRTQRIQKAKANGTILTPTQLAAPMSPAELKSAAKVMRSRTGRGDFSEDEVADRLESMVTEE